MSNKRMDRFVIKQCGGPSEERASQMVKMTERQKQEKALWIMTIHDSQKKRMGRGAQAETRRRKTPQALLFGMPEKRQRQPQRVVGKQDTCEL